jgi:hypothetical protein
MTAAARIDLNETEPAPPARTDNNNCAGADTLATWNAESAAYPIRIQTKRDNTTFMLYARPGSNDAVDSPFTGAGQ